MSPADDMVTSLSAAYLVLAGLLPLLEAQGFRAPLSQRLDILHDFVLRDWPAITTRFGGRVPRRYLTTAFGRFVRRRVIEERRLYAELVPGEVEDRRFESDHEGRFGAVEVRQWLARLAPEDRQLIIQRFVEDRSERDLAAERKITRHELRQRLESAVAALVAAGDNSDTFPVRAARALFLERLPIHAASASLGVSEQRIRAGRDAFLSNLRLLRSS